MDRSELEGIHRPRLRALRAARRRRRCFIIGDGRSLSRADLARLRTEATFATDDFDLSVPDLDWSPTYHVVEDHLVGENRAEALGALTGPTKLFPASLADAIVPDEHTIFFDHRARVDERDGFDFSFDADRNTWAGGGVVYTCMQLAAYLGYQEIYLVGADADDVPAAYAEARRATESRGISIVNATAHSTLDVFRRVDFEMLFRAIPGERLLLIDHSQVGNGTASGEVKAAVLGNWPRHQRLQLYDAGRGGLRLDGGPETASGVSLDERIASFDADVILYRPAPRMEALHALAMDVIARTNVPLAVWIMDDWPVGFAVDAPEQAMQLDADLRQLLDRADARFSISPAMSTAFHERYGHHFVPIANGIDPADWSPPQERTGGTVVVRYAGSLAENMTLASVGLVARAVEELRREGLDISFEVKTHQRWRETHADWAAELEHTRVSTSDLSVAEYRRWLTDADILLIAYNFDDRSRDYIRYSLANKVPECLASGAAVLAVGPDDVATIATLAALNVGVRITQPDEALVGATLRRLAESPAMRLELAQRGRAAAFSQFDVSQTRQAFDATLGQIARGSPAGAETAGAVPA